MQLIKKIEINFLRSLYSAVLNDVGDLNVIFGRNDSGKSNLLRALSLFFNDETEPTLGLDFYLDLSDVRRDEARRAKGRQAIWMKLTFNVPSNFQNSLGREVVIKRQWNRDGNVTETIWPTNLSGAKSAQLTKFRNQIDFTYIPAVKDLGVYADLIERMYGAASESIGLQEATSEFVEAIQSQTIDLSNELTSMFGGPARLAAPTEMSKLFRSLDFAHGVEGHSLLRQKGDGIKARHLPELLRYINTTERSKRLFIWGFEEPENSLDLGAADAEARRFAYAAGRSDTQVFITSHSPAFYLANHDDSIASLRRFFITKQRPDEEGVVQPTNAASAIDKLEDAEDRMSDAGLLQLPFVIRRLSKLQEEIDNLAAEREALKNRLDNLERPTLFVEGKHDVAIFEASIERLGIPGGTIDVKPLEGTPKSAAELLKAVSKAGKNIGSAKCLFLFDNDKAGRQAYKAVVGGKPTDEPVAVTQKVSSWVLPASPEFTEFVTSWEIPSDAAFFTAEFLFPISESANLCKILVEQKHEQGKWAEINIHGDYWNALSQQKLLELIKYEPGTVEWLYLRGVPDPLKREFIEMAHLTVSTDPIENLSTIVMKHLGD